VNSSVFILPNLAILTANDKQTNVTCILTEIHHAALIHAQNI